MTRRLDRVCVLLRQELSLLISSELHDPRLSSVVSITQVKISSDLKQAKVYVSVLGDDDDKQLSLKALKSAAGYLQKELRDSLPSFRSMPRLNFFIDESIEQGSRVLEVMRRTGFGSSS